MNYPTRSPDGSRLRVDLADDTKSFEDTGVSAGSAVSTSTGVDESEALVRTSELFRDAEDVDSKRPAPNCFVIPIPREE